MTEAEARVGADLRLSHPTTGDGRHLWRIARDSATLDLNSAYAYILWCSDFADTSVVAYVDDQPVGFITGYRRPSGSLMVWQVAVDADHRGRGLAATMLEWLADVVGGPDGPLVVETTVTLTNTASRALFASFARRHAMVLTELEGFGAGLFPDGHEAEPFLRMTPESLLNIPQ